MEKVLYFHSGVIKGMLHGEMQSFRATAAGVIKDGFLLIGVAKCSSNDQFVKASGRAKAAGFALSEKRRLHKLPIAEGAEYKHIAKKFHDESLEHFHSLGEITWFGKKQKEPVVAPV